jgi:hypothetical protein
MARLTNCKLPFSSVWLQTNFIAIANFSATKLPHQPANRNECLPIPTKRIKDFSKKKKQIAVVGPGETGEKAAKPLINSFLSSLGLGSFLGIWG